MQSRRRFLLDSKVPFLGSIEPTHKYVGVFLPIFFFSSHCFSSARYGQVHFCGCRFQSGVIILIGNASKLDAACQVQLEVDFLLICPLPAIATPLPPAHLLLLDCRKSSLRVPSYFPLSHSASAFLLLFLFTIFDWSCILNYKSIVIHWGDQARLRLAQTSRSRLRFFSVFRFFFSSLSVVVFAALFLHLLQFSLPPEFRRQRRLIFILAKTYDDDLNYRWAWVCHLRRGKA